MKCRIDLIVGTRPNMVKLASLHAALHQSSWCSARVVFIHQHDALELGSGIMESLLVADDCVGHIPLPAGDLGTRLGAMVSGCSQLLTEERPDLALVFGDVDTTLAGAIAVKRAGILLGHVESGLRSHDRSMPEELNRRMVDSISDLHFATSADAADNLRQEGHGERTIHLVGNPMIDALSRHVNPVTSATLCKKYNLPERGYVVATFHRPSNVDTTPALERLARALGQCAERLPVWLPLHPRTWNAICAQGMRETFERICNLRLGPAHPYVEFVNILSQARLVITDSGGVQEETSWLGVPCMTMRQNTERPITIELGTNRLVDELSLGTVLDEILGAPMPGRRGIPLWDGHAGTRIAGVLEAWWTSNARQTP